MYKFYSYAYTPREDEFQRSIMYAARLAENQFAVKIILDKIITSRDEEGFIEVATLSDDIEAVVFNKQSLEIDDEETLLALAEMERYCPSDENFKALDRILSLKFDKYEEHALVYNGVTIDVNDVVSTFIRRVVFFKNKRLFKLAPEMMQHDAHYLAKYLNDIDNIEKLLLTISEDSVRKQVRDRTLTFFDGGKKLKSIVGLPIDIISAIDAYGSGDVIHYFQNYVKSGVGNVDEIRKMLEWLDAIKKLNRKRKISWYVNIDSGTISLIGEIIALGCSITSVINACSKEMLMYSVDQTFDLDAALRTIRDTIQMQREIGIDDNYINQNLYKWHFITARNCKILKVSRQDEYLLAAQIINRNSRKVDSWLIKCPESEQELFDIGNQYNNCLPIYRDKVIDEGAIIYSMYKVDNDGNIVDPMPPITFEVNNNLDFIQIKTFNDADVTDPAIINTIKKWRTQIRKQERRSDVK